MENRIALRTTVQIPVEVATVLTAGEGTMTDLSETGAKIHFGGVNAGDRVTIVLMGQDVCGQAAWAEPDRFGMRFDQAISSGPLHAMIHRAPVQRRAVFGRRAA